jgi:hypothetical protein
MSLWHFGRKESKKWLAESHEAFINFFLSVNKIPKEGHLSILLPLPALTFELSQNVGASLQATASNAQLCD